MGHTSDIGQIRSDDGKLDRIHHRHGALQEAAPDRRRHCRVRSKLDPVCPVERYPRLTQVRGGVGRQNIGSRRHRRHDHRLGRQNACGFGDDVRPSLGGEHQVGAHVLAPLVVLPAVQQGRVVQQGLGFFELLGVDKSACQCNTRMGRLGDGDGQIRTSLDRCGQCDTETIGLPVQARSERVQLLQGRQVIVTGGDSAQPGISHRRIRFSGLSKESASPGRIRIEGRHRLVEVPTGGHGGNTAGHDRSAISSSEPVNAGSLDT